MTRIKRLLTGQISSFVTAAQMRALEGAAIASGQVTGGVLMARAGQGVVAAILSAWPDLAARPGRAVVLCGPGNNGGDGYVVARLLAGLGWQVSVFALGDPERLPADARAALDLWRTRGAVLPLDQAGPFLAAADLVVDALFGIGLTRGLVPELCAVLAKVPVTAHRVAIDVPSGRATDGDEVLGACAFEADLVVTFHAAKPVHAALADLGVAVVIADIGL